MSRYNGTDDELSYGEALVALAERVTWRTEDEQREVVTAIQKEHGIYVEPEVIPDPEAIAREKELAKLREDNAKLKAAAEAREKEAELAKLREENEKLAKVGAKK